MQVKTGKDQNNILHVVVRMVKLQKATGYLCLLDVYHRKNYVQRIIHSKTGRMSQCVCHALGKGNTDGVTIPRHKSPARKMVCIVTMHRMKTCHVVCAMYREFQQM